MAHLYCTLNSSVACLRELSFTALRASARGPRIGRSGSGTGSTISSVLAHCWRRLRSSPGPAIWLPSTSGAWWCSALIRRIDPAIIVRGDGYVGLPRDMPTKPALLGWRQRTYPLQSVVAAAMIILAVAFVFSPSESRNPGRYGLRAWSNFPSLLKWPFARPKGCVQMDCVANLPAASDVALIASRTQPHEQVAIVLDLYDWAYLLAAHRPPLMFFLPSAVIFTREQLEESLRRINNANYLFVPKGPSGAPDIPLADVNTVIAPLLGTKFQKDGEGERLVAWKRVTGQDNNGTR